MTNHTLESWDYSKMNIYIYIYSLTCYTSVTQMLAFIANTRCQSKFPSQWEQNIVEQGDNLGTTMFIIFFRN